MTTTALKRATVIRMSAEVDIDRPATEVWGVLADYRRDTEWRRGVTRMEPAPAGPVANGTTTDEVLRLGGRTYRNLGVVTAVDPGVGFSWQTTEGADAHGARAVHAVSTTRCVARLELEVRVTGGERLLAPLLGRMLRRNLGTDMQRLRRLCESSAVGGRASAAERGGPSSTRV